MTDISTCPLDDAQLTPDRYVCSKCTATLRGLLSDVPALISDLMVARTKQAHFTTRVGSRTTGDPLGYAPAAREAAWVLTRTLVTWAEHVTAIRGHRMPETWAEVGDYLRRWAIPWLSKHPDGPQAVDELTAAIRQARRAIDRPADRAYVGICGALIEATDPTSGMLAPVDCPQQLYALADHPTVECPRCGTAWNVTERQAAMLASMADLLLPAVDIARAIDGLGTPVTPEAIRQWKHRGQLGAALDGDGRARADRAGRPLYRVGDVLALVEGRAVSVASGNVAS